MENKIVNRIIMINYTFLIIAMIVSAMLHINYSIQILFLYLIILSSYTVRTYFAYNTYEDKTNINNKKEPWIFLIVTTYLIEITIVIILQKYDTYMISFIVLSIIIEDIVVNINYNISLIVSIGIYLVSCIILYFKYVEDSYSMIVSILLILPVYITIFIIFSLINYLLKQNQVIEASLKDITIKNLEKDNLYVDLKEAYSKVESITALRERNKIAAEIHDTVGHTLTTVLVELEASKRLMKKDIVLASEKLNLAQEQVRKGLNDIRGSVRILEKGQDILDFYNSLMALIAYTRKYSEVAIETIIDKDIKISNEIGEIIFYALMEGLTNGIRHGKSTAFIFKLYFKENTIFFSLQDNGKGASIILPGFGLRAMRARAEENKGTINITSIEGQGVTLDIAFPVS